MKRIIYPFLVLFVLFSCRRDDVTWQTEMLLPLAQGSLSIEDFAANDSTFSSDGNGLLSVVLSEEIYTAESPLDSLVDLQIEPLDRTVNLESLELSSINFSDTVFIEEIAEMIAEDGFTISDGDQVPGFIINSTDEFNMDPVQIDISQYIEMAVLETGFFNTTITNETPFIIENITLEVRNAGSNDVLVNHSFSSIQPGEQRNFEIDLAAEMDGTPVEGQLEVRATEILIRAEDGSESYPVNYDDYISLNASIYDITVQEAIAVFPAQNIIDNTDEVSLIDMDDVQLTEAMIDKGVVTVEVTSTVPTEMYVTYIIPSATKNGQQFEFSTTVPPAPVGESINVLEEFPFDGYLFDLTGVNGDTINTFENTLRARIDSTGEKIPLTLEDSISLTLQVTQMDPQYVKGYIGNHTFTSGLDTSNTEMLRKIQGGTINFEDITASMHITNGMGVPGHIELKQLVSRNRENNENFSSSSLPVGVNIEAGSQSGTSINPTTANMNVPEAEDYFNILPDQYLYEVGGEINPDGNTPPYSNFLNLNATISGRLDLDIPLSFRAEDLTIIDTIDFDMQTEGDQNEQIKEGELVLIGNNGYPIDMIVSMEFINPMGEVVATLSSTDEIAAANTDSEGLVTEAKETKIRYPMSGEKLNRINTADRVVLNARFTTQPEGQHLKLYDFYQLDINLVGDFEYEAKN